MRTYLDKVNSPGPAAIRNYMSRNNLRSVRARLCHVRPENMRKRREFVQKYSSKPVSFWKRVIWTDETSIRLPDDNEISFWSYLGSEGLGEIIPIDGKFDSFKYIEILRTRLLPIAHTGNVECTLMHDCHPVHTSIDVKSFIDCNRINVLQWPPQSTNMNPIESCFKKLKSRLKGKLKPGSSIERSRVRPLLSARRTIGSRRNF